MNDASYLCNICGEEIVIPVDISDGREQMFSEDCPVCCHPHTIRVRFRRDGSIRCEAESE
ncbi:MAG: CPXCG motif-containing cysteine-rich protein [Planctomycetaceae bacterium]